MNGDRTMQYGGKYGRCKRAAPHRGSISRHNLPAVITIAFEIITIAGEGEDDEMWDIQLRASYR